MPMNKPSWTEKEDSKLRDVYPKQGLKFAARSFPDRSYSAVRNRVFLLRLKREKS